MAAVSISGASPHSARQSLVVVNSGRQRTAARSCRLLNTSLASDEMLDPSAGWNDEFCIWKVRRQARRLSRYCRWLRVQSRQPPVQ